ncbi:MAG: glycosyltransferase family 4 protein [Candidatus Moranbacteria bacterium]|nr:glycosyltransferase family 4 protein [Candidatus Moranbacteria bacterium]
MKPYIAINATALFKPQKTGIEWYSWQLIKYLAREWKKSDPPVALLAPRDLIKQRGDKQSIISLLPKNKNWHIKPLPGKYFWTQYRLSKFLKRYPPALLFSPAYVAPRFLPKSILTVNTVHGLEGEYFPEISSFQKTLIERFLYLPALKKSTRIIAVSEHTKKDLHYFFGIPLEKIATVLSGPGTLDEETYTVENKLKLPLAKNVKFFFLGGENERKNLEMALKIFLKIKKTVRKQHAVSLYIAGNIPNKLKKIISSGEKNIALLGYVSEKEKIRQLKSANFLLYPSFYEGFGFPVLEAQALGTVPVVLKGSGVAEIGGRGLIEINPTSQEKDFAVELASTIRNPEKYKELQTLSQKNIQRFSWRCCAAQVRKILTGLTDKNNA